MVGSRMVAQALDKVDSGYRREALQLFHRELQRPVHKAVDQKAMLLGIEIRSYGATVRADKVERRRCDNSYRVLERSQDMKRHAELVRRRPLSHGFPKRGDETRSLAIRGQIFQRCCWFR